MLKIKAGGLLSNKMNPKPGDPSDPAIIAAIQHAELSQKLASVEKKIEKLEDSLTERHHNQITRMFNVTTALIGLCAILVAVLSWLARSDTKSASDEMKETAKESKADVKQAVFDMNRKFDALAGEGLKKASLQVMYRDRLLDGQVLDIPQNNLLELHPLFMKNSGNKRIDSVTIRFYTSARISLNGAGWVGFTSSDTNFPTAYVYYFARNISIDAKETYTLEEPISIMPMSLQITNATCKLIVYYGTDKPAEATFQVQTKP